MLSTPLVFILRMASGLKANTFQGAPENPKGLMYPMEMY